MIHKRLVNFCKILRPSRAPLLRVLGLAAALGGFHDTHVWGAPNDKSQPAAAAPVVPEGPPVFEGHLLVTPILAKDTVLLNADKTEAHVWSSAYFAAAGARLLSDGSILRVVDSTHAEPYRKTRFLGGRLQRIAWDGGLIWDFWNAADAHMVCGDAIQLPNGNVLMSVVEYRSKADCLNMGRDPRTVPDIGLFAPGLMEFQPIGKNGGRLAWRWSLWDHLSQGRNSAFPHYDATLADPHRVDIEKGMPGLGMAFSEISYDPKSDLIVVTVPVFGELWALDHSASMDETKTEVGGKCASGGAVLARWRLNVAGTNLPKMFLVSAVPSPASDPAALISLQVLGRAKDTQVAVKTSMTRLAFRKTRNQDAVSLDGVTGGPTAWDHLLPNVLDAPTGCSMGPDGAWFVTAAAGGDISMIGPDGQKKWEFLNQRGKKQIRIHAVKPGEECCAPVAQFKRLADEGDARIEAGTVGTARYYARDYLPPSLLQKEAVH